MKYLIEMTPVAELELRSSFEYIHNRDPHNATRWLKSLLEAIRSLETFPTRCGTAPESEHLGEPMKHLIFKSHRIIFFVDETAAVVRILYVRHAKMRAIGEVDES